MKTDDPKKTQHLMSLEGAKERLQLFKADLLEEGSFDSLVNGCQGVFHTASPVLVSVTDPQVWLRRGSLSLICTMSISVLSSICVLEIITDNISGRADRPGAERNA